ncbi:MAG: hypothetical protein GYA47_03075 [Desulfovibrio sp.]|nr:hypothetical protein [Desulfovibrio sp.]
MIFNVDSDIADRLEALRDEAKNYGKRLDVDTAVNKGLEKFLKKAEKKFEELRHEAKGKKRPKPADLVLSPGEPPALPGEKALAEKAPGEPDVPTPEQIGARIKDNPILGKTASKTKP